MLKAEILGNIIQDLIGKDIEVTIPAGLTDKEHTGTKMVKITEENLFFIGLKGTTPQFGIQLKTPNMLIGINTDVDAFMKEQKVKAVFKQAEEIEKLEMKLGKINSVQDLFEDNSNK